MAKLPLHKLRYVQFFEQENRAPDTHEHTSARTHTPAVRQLVPAFVAGNLAADLGQHVVSVLQGVPGCVAVEDLQRVERWVH
jgi:hypothetical protein